MSLIKECLIAISDHGNYLLNKVINYLGLLSFSAGTVLGVANQTTQKVINASPEPWGLPDYAALVSVLVGISYLLKNAVDIYFKFKNKGKDE